LHNHKLCRDLAFSCPLVGRELTIVSVFGASVLRISTSQPDYQSRERGKSKGKGKGKIHRITVHEGPKYGFKLSLTLALDEGWVVKSPPPPQLFYARERDRHSLYRRLGGSHGPVWFGEENVAPTGIRSPDRLPISESLLRHMKAKCVFKN